MTKMTIAEAGRRAMAERNARHDAAEAVRPAPEAVSDLLSDMDRAVLRMPIDLALSGDMAQAQYHARVQSLLNRIEAATQPVKVATRLTRAEVKTAWAEAVCRPDKTMTTDGYFVALIQRAFAEKNGMTLAGGEVDRG
jgi:hypothetical protein